MIERPKREQSWDDVEIIEIDSHSSEVVKWEKSEEESGESQQDQRETMWQTHTKGEHFS